MLGIRRFLPVAVGFVLCTLPRLRAQEMPPSGLLEGQPVTTVDLVARPPLDAESFRHLISCSACSSYPRIYGALGGFIILMLWIASLIALVGAVADYEIERSALRAGVA